MALEHTNEGIPAGRYHEDKEQKRKDQSAPKEENTTLAHGATHLDVRNPLLHRSDPNTDTPVYAKQVRTWFTTARSPRRRPRECQQET